MKPEDKAVAALERIVLHACKTANPNTVSTYAIPAYAEAISTLVEQGRMEYLPSIRPAGAKQAKLVAHDDSLRVVRESA